MQSDQVVLTLTSEPSHPGLIRLLRSAHKFGWPLRPVFINRITDYDEFIFTKHLLIRKELERFKKQLYTRFLFLDAWDTQFVAEQPVFTLREQKEKVLCFGAELNCHPDHQLVQQYPPEALIQEFSFLNSGVIWGEIDTYLELCPLAQGHDQEVWTKAFLASPERFWLDHTGKVVLNLHSVGEQELSRFSDGVRYNPTGTWPAILHANGKWPFPSWVS